MSREGAEVAASIDVAESRPEVDETIVVDDAAEGRSGGRSGLHPAIVARGISATRLRWMNTSSGCDSSQLRLLDRSGAFGLSISSCSALAERFALHTIEQLLHRDRVRGFIPLRQYHCTGGSNPAEHCR
jgi:hypothetical protein